MSTKITMKSISKAAAALEKQADALYIAEAEKVCRARKYKKVVSAYSKIIDKNGNEIFDSQINVLDGWYQNTFRRNPPHFVWEDGKFYYDSEN